MIQVYADDDLIFDTRLPDLELLGLTVTRGLNKGGTASIVMPQNHPAYDRFVSFKTLVTVYRDRKLIFRGRALYPSDDWQQRRTITCEGERCFLRDGTIRPYAYQDAPAAIFADVIGLYNAQVEAHKQFKVGTVNVTDPNNYIQLDSEEAEHFSDTVDKLVKRCGGYIVFTTNAEGQRTINWYTSVEYRSAQVIEFGSNLMDFNRSTANADLATVVIPYGAKDETTGRRITIESVNDGLDFIQDYDAVALRGVVSAPVIWDDITDPAALLLKAQQYLAESKNLITSLELTALDLSLLDKSIDDFDIGDKIRVRSKPHRVDDDFQLQEQTLDLFHPENDRITLGKSITSLTGADAAGDRRSAYDLQKAVKNVKADFVIDNNAVVAETRQELTTLIQQTSDAIMLEVSEEYATNGELTSAISTTMTQLSDSFEFLFSQMQVTVDANDASAREQFAEIEKYIRFEDGNIILGESGNDITLRIENDRISFLDAGAEVAYFSNKHLTVLDGTFLNSLRVGAFAFIPRDNGNLSLVKVGD